MQLWMRAPLRSSMLLGQIRQGAPRHAGCRHAPSASPSVIRDLELVGSKRRQVRARLFGRWGPKGHRGEGPAKRAPHVSGYEIFFPSGRAIPAPCARQRRPPGSALAAAMIWRSAKVGGPTSGEQGAHGVVIKPRHCSARSWARMSGQSHCRSSVRARRRCAPTVTSTSTTSSTSG
jgi:hypothetical protein